MSFPETAVDFHDNSNLFQIDFDSVAGSLRMILYLIDPQQNKTIEHERLAPWFNPKTCILKQTSQYFDRGNDSKKLN